MPKGYRPYIVPLAWWASLWLTHAHEIGSALLKAPARNDERKAAPIQFKWDRNRRRGDPRKPGDTHHERARTVAGNLRLLPADRPGRITFGRRAVNDGKLANRLRHGGRITTETLDRIRSFMATDRTVVGGPRSSPGRSTAVSKPRSRRAHCGARPHPCHADAVAPSPSTVAATVNGGADPQRNFRFFDNRQKYLLFVHTCSEKWVVANRVSIELANIHPRPPALRLFDAGVGDGTVLLRMLRAMHDRFPHTPFYVVGKEISLEDVRLAMQKMSDRFTEHPATVLVLTNLAYADAPWLAVKSLTAASSMVWHEVSLTGSSAHQFEQQITGLVPFLNENWKAGVSPKTGNPVYDRPVVLVIYREDHKFLLDPILPRPAAPSPTTIWSSPRSLIARAPPSTSRPSA